MGASFATQLELNFWGSRSRNFATVTRKSRFLFANLIFRVARFRRAFGRFYGAKKLGPKLSKSLGFEFLELRGCRERTCQVSD